MRGARGVESGRAQASGFVREARVMTFGGAVTPPSKIDGKVGDAGASIVA